MYATEVYFPIDIGFWLFGSHQFFNDFNIIYNIIFLILG